MHTQGTTKGDRAEHRLASFNRKREREREVRVPGGLENLSFRVQLTEKWCLNSVLCLTGLEKKKVKKEEGRTQVLQDRRPPLVSEIHGPGIDTRFRTDLGPDFIWVKPSIVSHSISSVSSS